MTVFLPLTMAAARELRATGSVADVVGYADGPALRRWLGGERLEDEEADYVALNNAGVAALLLDEDAPTRLVLAVDLELTGDDVLGAVSVPEVRWADVRSLFADERSAADTVRAARQAVRGLDLGAALAVPAVADLQDAYDLLWYAPEELDALAPKVAG